MNIKIGLVADLHIGCRGGSNVWREFIKSYLINYMIPTFKDNNVTNIVQLGDLMDVRRSLYGLDRHWIVTEFIPALQENNLTFHTLTGNHDCSLKEVTSHSNWSLWVESEGKGCIKAYTKPQDVLIGNLLVSVCPWVSKENLEDTILHIENTEATVNVGHWELESFLMSKGNLSKTGTFDKKSLEKFEKCLSGHFHTESYQSNKGGMIKYLGTPYCLDWGSYGDNTEHGLYLLDELTEVLDFIPNPEGMSMFSVLEYNYEDIASAGDSKKWHDTDFLNGSLNLKDKVIRINVTDRSNASHYTKFIKTLRSVACIDYTVVDTTQETVMDFEEVSAKDFKISPLDILLNKINDIEYCGDDDEKEIRYESVGKKLQSVYNKCQNESNLI